MQEPSSEADLLQALFERCVVQVTIGGQHNGSGFFVAPGRVLTCAHVVRDSIEVGIVWEGLSLPAQVPTACAPRKLRQPRQMSITTPRSAPGGIE
jgi:hypothetical protein